MNTISLIFFGVFAVIVVITIIVNRKRRAAMEAFAANRGWKQLAADEATLGSFVPDSLRGQGDSHNFDLGFAATAGEHAVRLFNYSYDQQQADPNNNTTGTTTVTYRFTVAGMDLKHQFDPLYLRRRRHGDATAQYAHKQKLSLEGDFNTYFDVYAPEGAEVDALSLLTPDVMAFLEDNGKDFDIQVDGHRLTVIGDASCLSPQHVDTLLDFISRLADILARKPAAKAAAAAGEMNSPAPTLEKATLLGRPVARIAIIGIVVIALLPFILIAGYAAIHMLAK